MPDVITIHWLCWQPTPYNAYLFRSLAEDPEVDLTVHFRARRIASHPWEGAMTSGFKSRCYRRVLGVDWNVVRLAATQRTSFFVLGGWDEPTVASVALTRIASGAPFALWTDTPVARHRGPIKAAIRDLWLARLFGGATYVLGTGRPALQVLRGMGCPGEKLVNFPYFVDLAAFTPSARRSGQPTVFLSSGRLVNSLKGYDLALRALARAAELTGRPPGSISYRIAGTGPDLAALRRLAGELGLTGVEFVGWLEASALPGFYAGGDVLLSPSRVEPYSVAVLEAMASGLVVVASDATGAALDRIEPGVNGFIHPTDDLDALAGHLARLLSEPGCLQVIGGRARQTAEQWPVSRAASIVKQAARPRTGMQRRPSAGGRPARTGDR